MKSVFSGWLLGSWLAGPLPRRRSPSKHERIDSGNGGDGLEPPLAPESSNDPDKRAQRRTTAALEISQSSNADACPRGKRGLVQVPVYPKRLQSFADFHFNLGRYPLRLGICCLHITLLTPIAGRS
jgi:hypothetical protein